MLARSLRLRSIPRALPRRNYATESSQPSTTPPPSATPATSNPSDAPNVAQAIVVGPGPLLWAAMGLTTLAVFFSGYTLGEAKGFRVGSAAVAFPPFPFVVKEVIVAREAEDAKAEGETKK